MHLHSRYECVYRCLSVLVNYEDLLAFLTNTSAFVFLDKVDCEFLGLKVYLLLQLLEVVEITTSAIIIAGAVVISAATIILASSL